MAAIYATLIKDGVKDQIQSYIMTTAKYDFSVYEKRILYRIVARGRTPSARW